jgi:CrcB protein
MGVHYCEIWQAVFYRAEFLPLAERCHVLLTPSVRLFLITGFLGALTIFSSFSLETTNAVRAGLTLQPIMNIMINNLGGFGLTFLGYWLGSIK